MEKRFAHGCYPHTPLPAHSGACRWFIITKATVKHSITKFQNHIYSDYLSMKDLTYDLVPLGPYMVMVDLNCRIP